MFQTVLENINFKKILLYLEFNLLIQYVSIAVQVYVVPEQL
jgi:hypothetical protein